VFAKTPDYLLKRAFLALFFLPIHACNLALPDCYFSLLFRLVNFGQKCYINRMEGKELSKRQRAYREIGKVLVNFGNLT